MGRRTRSGSPRGPELRNAWPAKASEWPASAGRSAKTVSWSFHGERMAARGKDTTMRTLFVATAAFAALVMIAPIGAPTPTRSCASVCGTVGDVSDSDMSFKDEGVDLSVATGNASALPAGMRNTTVAAIAGHRQSRPHPRRIRLDDKTNELHAFFKGMKELFIGLNRPAGAPNRDRYDLSTTGLKQHGSFAGK